MLMFVLPSERQSASAIHWLGANKPAYELDPGFLEHPRLSPRAVIGPGARFLASYYLRGPHADDAAQEEEMELLHPHIPRFWTFLHSLYAREAEWELGTFAADKYRSSLTTSRNHYAA
jgi:hypothetical protein